MDVIPAIDLRAGKVVRLIQGQYDLATAELDKSYTRGPDDPRLLELKGIRNLLSGDVSRAQQVFEELRRKGEANPKAPNLEGRLRLAHLYVLQGNYRQAQVEVSEGIPLARISDLAFDEVEFRSFLAYTELQLGRFSSAVEASKTAIEIARRIVDLRQHEFALHLLGLASLGMGQFEEAKKIAQQLHQLIERTNSPKSMRHYEHLMGQIALREGSHDEAIHHFDQAISLLSYQMEVYDEQAFYYDGLAAAYTQKGNWPKAIETYKSIISLTTGRLGWGDIYTRSYYWLGKCFQKSGNPTEARVNYRNFLQLWKNADEGLPEVADARKELEVLGRLP